MSKWKPRVWTTSGKSDPAHQVWQLISINWKFYKDKWILFFVHITICGTGSLTWSVSTSPSQMSNKPVLLEQYEHFITYLSVLYLTIFVWNLERYLWYVRKLLSLPWPNKSYYMGGVRYLESIYIISQERNKSIICIVYRQKQSLCLGGKSGCVTRKGFKF